MSIKAVIFDFDGTLVDSLGDIVLSMNKVLRESGFPEHGYEEYRYLVGKGIMDLVINSLPEENRGKNEIMLHYKWYTQMYKENCLITTSPFEGIQDLLSGLKKKKIKTAVLSNKADDFTRYMCKQVFPKENFSVVLGARDGVPSKPHPALSLEIAQDLKVDSEDILFLGDSGSDMKTAVNAHMIPGGVLWGYRDREELETNGAKYIFEKPEDVLAVFN